jgi:lipopolysaccharide/colanic/teichoic acid biosynthesis glycosyltransferase
MNAGLTVRQRVIKRTFDVAVAGVGLILLWPLILTAAAVARIETGEPGFFRQTRVGRNGQCFELLKIRTMRTDPAYKITVTVDGDPRITRWGRIFRRTKIDELPQLLNVLRGDMSIVGPRPDVPGFHDRLEGEDRVLLSVRPGMTGPAALHFRGEERLLTNVDDPIAYSANILFARKVAIDKAHIEHYRLVSDIRCIVDTIRAVLRPHRSMHQSDVTSPRAHSP